MDKRKATKGGFLAAFTLVEMTTVMVLLGVLTTVIVLWTMHHSERAKVTKAIVDINSIKTGIIGLYMDTARFPHGCISDSLAGFAPSDALDLQAVQAGLLNQPPEGATAYPDCYWPQRAVNDWGGPYIDSKNLHDPWNGFYLFYPAYCFCTPGCAENPGDNIVDCRNYDATAQIVQECEFSCGVAFCDKNKIMVISPGADYKSYTCDDIGTLVTSDSFN